MWIAFSPREENVDTCDGKTRSVKDTFKTFGMYAHVSLCDDSITG